MIKKTLIANRSEIASRIQFTCQKMGIKTVTIYAPQDKHLKYLFDTNQNFELSGQGIESYLNQNEIIKIAKKTNSDAVHPGYGFLSENYQFAQKVVDAGLTWIGPSPKIIKQMGNKIEARKIMQQAKIPVIPGDFFNITQQQKAKSKALQISFPVVLKDPMGGGGIGIIKIENPERFDLAWNQISSVIQKHSKSKLILLEKYIAKGRHIEIQICGDGKNYIHLYERECSIQRRHQKIIEESPCNFLDKNLLNEMYYAAIKAAKTAKYDNIGTIEFIVTQNNQFYFLEINPRLQVEHSVTEQVTGIDLVEMQIKIASNNKLLCKQQDISKQGHAIECRIYAENPKENFAPSSGKIYNLQIPNFPFSRIDHNLANDLEITPFFDPMIAKITTRGKTRNEAIDNIKINLKNFSVFGIKTNILFLQRILNSKEFESGKIHTQLLSDESFFKKLIKENIENLDEKQVAVLCAELFKEIIQKEKLNQKEDKSISNQWKQQQWR